MLTKEQLNKFCDAHNIETLEEWVREFYDNDDLLNIANYGCEGGINGILYYAEINVVYNKFNDDIWSILAEYAEDCDYKSVLHMLAELKGHDIQTADNFNSWTVWIAVEIIAQRILEERRENDAQSD